MWTILALVGGAWGQEPAAESVDTGVYAEEDPSVIYGREAARAVEDTGGGMGSSLEPGSPFEGMESQDIDELGKQVVADATILASDDFSEMNDWRKAFAERIAARTAQIQQQGRTLRWIAGTVSELRRVQSRFERLEVEVAAFDQPDATPSAEADYARRSLHQLRRRHQSPTNVASAIEHGEALRKKEQAILQGLREDLSVARAGLRLVESRLDQLLSPEVKKQEFKGMMSLGATLLVASVIVGFFAVALRDQQIRRAVFAGTSGVQFLTMFALVIAIILFGMTGVLEGRELAALLASLSGYILGKYGDRPAVEEEKATKAGT